MESAAEIPDVWLAWMRVSLAFGLSDPDFFEFDIPELPADRQPTPETLAAWFERFPGSLRPLLPRPVPVSVFDHRFTRTVLVHQRF